MTLVHIKNTTTELTWCNEIIVPNEFYFKDLEQAAINGQFGDKPICDVCVLKVNDCLNSYKEK